MSKGENTVHEKKYREQRADITYAIISSLREIKTRDSREASGDEFLLRLLATKFPVLQIMTIYITDCFVDEGVA